MTESPIVSLQTRRNNRCEQRNSSDKLPGELLLHVQQPGGFKTAYEEEYRHIQSNEWKNVRSNDTPTCTYRYTERI
jgi:hypothetical protein